MIKVAKLVNGDEIIADVETHVDGNNFKNPFKIVMSREGLGLMPFMLFSKDKNFVLNNQHVVAMGEPEDEMRNAYSSQVGGIVVPTNNMLITE